MEVKENVIVNNKHSILNKGYFLLVYILFISQFKEYLFNYFENNYQVGNISEYASIIDITDYHNLYLLITTENKIYTGIPPNKKSETTSNIINITSAATYDTNYVILACTGDYFLSQINIYTGDEVPLLNYSNVSLSVEKIKYICSISILDNIVYLGIIRPLDNILKRTAFKIGLMNSNEKNNGPILNAQIIKNYTLSSNLTNINDLIYSRLISCEVISRINNIEDPRLVCGYLRYYPPEKVYKYYASVANDNFAGFEKEIEIKTSSILLNFRLQKINTTFIRYLIPNNSYEIYMDSDFKIYKAKKAQRNPYLFKFDFGVNTFYYNNQHIFYANPNGENFYLFMKSSISNNTIGIQERNKCISNCMGYYDKNNDKSEMIYQYENIIKYFIVQNKNSLFYYQCKTKIIETLSYTNIIFNMTDLMTSPLEHEKLYNAYIVNYISTTEQNWSYDNGNMEFNQTTQILNFITNLNDWIDFHFYFFGEILDFNIDYFVVPTCILSVRTCAFKCGSCSQDYNTCDSIKCRKNFTRLRDQMI